MKRCFILLTDKAFSADVEARLIPPGGSGHVAVAYTIADLEAALAQSPERPRVISFGSGVVVPPDVLSTLGPAYNFHPGPPNYRGLFPSVYALYENAAQFGVTCHEMSAEIDAGPIVAVTRFAIPAHFHREHLDALTYQEMLAMVGQLADLLGDTTKPLPHVNETWSGPLRRKADFDALCKLPPDADEAEFNRRYRAIGEGPHHALTMDVDGQLVRLSARRDGTVVRGGKTI